VGRFGVAADPSGLLFMKMRYYDAASGRFVSPDPLGYRAGVNLYRYCNNSPIRYIDPLGGWSFSGWFLGDSWGKPGPLTTGEGAHFTPDQINQIAETGKMPSNPNYENLPAPLKIPGGIADSYMNGDPEGVHHYGKLTMLGADAITLSTGTLAHGVHGFAQDGIKILVEKKVENLIESHDPNEKVSPRGTGSESDRFLPPDTPIPYSVYFENASTASAPAQTVVVSDQLDAGLDASTFVLTAIAWGDHQVAIPAGAAAFHSRETITDYRPGVSKTWWVDVDVTVEAGSGNMQCTFTTLDPDAVEAPEDVHAGFLPPNDATHRGEGYVMFSVEPKSSLAVGTRIANTASIVFDTAAPIATNEVFNTIGTPQTNHAPVLVNPGNHSNAPGQAVSLQLSATDSDGDTLTYSATGLPPSLNVSPGNGLISGTISNSAHGSYNVSVSVSDGNGGSDTKTFTWTITAVAQTGSLQVTISPAAAVTAGAQWSIDGGATWNNSGTTINNVPVGTATVSFKDLAGWTKPGNQTATITAGATATATGAYTQSCFNCGCAGGTLDKINPSAPIAPQPLGDIAIFALTTGLLYATRRSRFTRACEK
jgi:RHS repeat-associated protein